MKQGSYEEINYGDEKFVVDTKTGKIIPQQNQQRTIKQQEDSLKSVAYAGIILVAVIIILGILA